MIEKQTYGPFEQKCHKDFSRADLEFYGINTFRSSFGVHIYINDDDVNEENYGTSRSSYAGCFFIFGHSECAGDENHCHIPKEYRRFDDRPSHPLTPAFKRVTVTEAIRKALESGSKITITLIAGTDADVKEIEDDKLLDFKGLNLAFFTE